MHLQIVIGQRTYSTPKGHTYQATQGVYNANHRITCKNIFFLAYKLHDKQPTIRATDTHFHEIVLYQRQGEKGQGDVKQAKLQYLTGRQKWEIISYFINLFWTSGCFFLFFIFFLYKNVELMKTQPSDFEDAIQIAFCCLKLLRANFRQMELYISSTILVFMLLKAIFLRAKDVIRFMYSDYRLIFFYIFLC